jgi:hypothetical protein
MAFHCARFAHGAIGSSASSATPSDHLNSLAALVNNQSD